MNIRLKINSGIPTVRTSKETKLNTSKKGNKEPWNQILQMTEESRNEKPDNEKMKTNKSKTKVQEMRASRHADKQKLKNTTQEVCFNWTNTAKWDRSWRSSKLTHLTPATVQFTAAGSSAGVDDSLLLTGALKKKLKKLWRVKWNELYFQH